MIRSRFRHSAMSSLSAICMVATAAMGQTGGGYDLMWNTIDSGGGVSIGGGYKIGSTIGQADAGTLAGGDYALDGGFWPGAAPATCGACQLYGDIAPAAGDCIVELGDVLCVLAGYAGAGCPQADVAPCGGDNIIELGDVLALLNAYSSIYLCSHPCAP